LPVSFSVQIIYYISYMLLNISTHVSKLKKKLKKTYRPSADILCGRPPSSAHTALAHFGISIKSLLLRCLASYEHSHREPY